MPESSASSAMRAERFDERTAENVASASTSVPPAVAREEIVCQSATTRPYWSAGSADIGLISVDTYASDTLRLSSGRSPQGVGRTAPAGDPPAGVGGRAAGHRH